MGEIRLICPDCATVYQVPETAIPAGGRDVECSECGLSWRATNPSLIEAAPEPQVETPEPPAAPVDKVDDTPAPKADFKSAPLEQRLPANVLNILREAVETERRARQAPDQSTPNRAPDIDWPATTITETAPQTLPERPTPQIAEVPESLPERRAIETAPVQIDELPSPPPAAAIAPPPQTAPRNSGYLIGMGLSAMLAAALVTAYVMAPRMADAGELGAALMDLRLQIDGARLWLDGLVR